MADIAADALSVTQAQGPTQALDAPPGYDMGTALTCTFLVDVASTMCIDWINAVPPYPNPFSGWKARNACSCAPAGYSVNDFAYSELIWSTFTYRDPKTLKDTTVSEPFGFVASGARGTFLVFRGSQTTADFAMDAEDSLVAYPAPTAGAPSGLEVEKGFLAVFNGIGDGDFPSVMKAAMSQLNLPWPIPLIVTGHSLGSTLGTLAIPALVGMSWKPAALGTSLQASPKVGNQAFANYYGGLGVSYLYRLTNIYDKVPTLPGNPQYVPVGAQATFGADYGSVPDNHDPCCCYSYALLNPQNPYNQGLGTCMDWHPSKSSG